VHTHAGFLIKVASEVAYEFDIRQGDVFFWLTDMGWVMGPLSTFGTHALGATLLLYEERPTPRVPDACGARRPASSQHAGRVADTDPGAQATWRRAARRQRDARFGARVRVNRRAMGRGLLHVAEHGCWSQPGADHQLLRWHRGRRRVPRSVCESNRSSPARSAVRRSGWTSTCSTRRGIPSATSSASSSAASRGPR